MAAGAGAAEEGLAAAYARGMRRALPRGGTVCAGLSGGMDSCALLHAAASCGEWRVVACHVNHGLSARAAGWERFCERLCAAWGVPLRVRRAAEASAGAGTGEAWAREARLRVFGEAVADGFADVVALAHHADDMAETVLFRLLRGCGAAGAGGMDAVARVRGVTLVRPWLEAGRERVAAYAAAHRLRWVEDEDNANAARRRNFLRLHGLPALAAGFENAAGNVAASGRRLREGAGLLRDLARMDEGGAVAWVGGAVVAGGGVLGVDEAREDGAVVGGGVRGVDGVLGDGGTEVSGGVRVGYFAQAGAARLRNWLYFSARERGASCGERMLDEAARQILAGAGGRFAFGEWELHCWRGGLFWARRLPEPPAEYAREVVLEDGEAAICGGRLVLRRAVGQGLSLAKTGGRVEARLRRGGEKLAPRGRPRRLVAKLLQEAGVPPWRRAYVPLLYSGGCLAGVAGVAVAGGFAAQEGEAGVTCEWVWGE